MSNQPIETLVMDVDRKTSEDQMIVKELAKLVQLRWQGELFLYPANVLGRNSYRKAKRVFEMPEPCEFYSGQAAWLCYAVSKLRGVPFVQVPRTGTQVTIRNSQQMPEAYKQKAYDLIRAVYTMTTLHDPKHSGSGSHSISSKERAWDRAFEDFSTGKRMHLWFTYPRSLSPYSVMDFIARWMKDNNWPVTTIPDRILYRINPTTEDLFKE